MLLCEFLNKFLGWQIININTEKQIIMRGCLSYVISIAAIALLICIVCWMFATEIRSVYVERQQHGQYASV